MRGKAVTQGVRRDPLFDFREGTGNPKGSIKLSRREWIDPVEPRKYPTRGACLAIIVAQKLQKSWGQHHMAILAAFALFDPDQHPLAVDIPGLQMCHFAGPQTAAIGNKPPRHSGQLGSSLRRAGNACAASFLAVGRSLQRRNSTPSDGY